MNDLSLFSKLMNGNIVCLVVDFVVNRNVPRRGT